MSEALQDGVDYILDGLAAALELERELGVRTVEIDRSLLAPIGVAAAPAAAAGQAVETVVPVARKDGREGRERPEGHGRDERSLASAKPQAAKDVFDFIFVHERPLSPKGIEMMAKIVVAMGKTAETAPVVVVPPLPAAKIVVALGPRALRMFFPGLRGSPGDWLKSVDGRDVLVSTSPEDIVRYATVTPALQKIKVEMWRNLKVVMQRAGK